jgi:L,D-peptidoglycan transpeptidase YkuD (ErfK/YbiS/YcfS/YnhG family)
VQGNLPNLDNTRPGWRFEAKSPDADEISGRLMRAGRFLANLVVTPRPVQSRSLGLMQAGGLLIPCALGRSGIVSNKREGDGGTPAGVFGLAAVLYRPDRVPRPRCGLPVTEIRENSGWCDDPADRAYNEPVDLPCPASAERLWRDDRLYDLIVVIDYNLKPTRKGKGSAIFLHIAAPDFAPTAGCVAISLPAMRRLLPRLGRATVIRIG